MAWCAEPGCRTQTKGAYCYKHAKARGYSSAYESGLRQEGVSPGDPPGGCHNEGRLLRDGPAALVVSATQEPASEDEPGALQQAQAELQRQTNQILDLIERNLLLTATITRLERRLKRLAMKRKA